MLTHPVTRAAYTPAEAAQVLGVTRQTVYNLIDRGQLRRYKVGRLTRIPVADVLSLVGGPDDVGAPDAERPGGVGSAGSSPNALAGGVAVDTERTIDLDALEVLHVDRRLNPSLLDALAAAGVAIQAPCGVMLVPRRPPFAVAWVPCPICHDLPAERAA